MLLHDIPKERHALYGDGELVRFIKTIQGNFPHLTIHLHLDRAPLTNSYNPHQTFRARPFGIRYVGRGLDEECSQAAWNVYAPADSRYAEYALSEIDMNRLVIHGN